MRKTLKDECMSEKYLDKDEMKALFQAMENAAAINKDLEKKLAVEQEKRMQAAISSGKKIAQLAHDKFLLNKKLVLAIEALEFYANLDSWTFNDDSCGKTEIRCIDEESCLYREDYEDDNESGTEIFGGKRARATLKQLSE